MWCTVSGCMCGGRTRIVFKSETSKAEMNPPLLPNILFHQAVEEEDEKSLNINKTFFMSFEGQDFLIFFFFCPLDIFTLHLSKAFRFQN